MVKIFFAKKGFFRKKVSCLEFPKKCFCSKKKKKKNFCSVEVRVLCQGGMGGLVKSPLIGQECKMVDGKQPSDWTIIQDGSSACD